MVQEISLALTPEQAIDQAGIEQAISKALGDRRRQMKGYRIMRRSVDARKGNITVHLKIEVFLDGENPEEKFPSIYFHHSSPDPSVIIAGAGPAGLFAALQFLEAGIKPIVIERGKKVKDRRRDIAALNRKHIVNPDSNYCFGEGGAGTYSDGKLYTRSTKRGDVRKILQLLVQHGASEEILIDAHPHIGTNKLPHIIENIRETILKYGGEIHFETRLKDLIIEEDQIKTVITESAYDGTEIEFPTNYLVLATGHSARDVFELLYQKNILIEMKPFAMGVRVEHPQELIDQIQYHCKNRHEVQQCRKFLPPSSYNLTHHVNGRGVYSFCMCPGGIIAPCATSSEEVVVNGWSPSKRNNPFANSGIVVEVRIEDLGKYKSYGKLAGLQYQRLLERMAYEAGGKTQTAPAQRLVDFVNKNYSSTLPETSYQPGIRSSPLHQLLPPDISFCLQEAFKAFGKKMKGYLTNDAVVHGVESRTSSPVRIPRDKETFEHIQIKGLYPVAEGAGYAGGIMSAAIDGQLAAKKISERIRSRVLVQ